MEVVERTLMVPFEAAGRSDIGRAHSCPVGSGALCFVENGYCLPVRLSSRWRGHVLSQWLSKLYFGLSRLHFGEFVLVVVAAAGMVAGVLASVMVWMVFSIVGP